ncbi:hypothetical protein GF359_05140 [candidate division WOR-3 bacterium]|uniref:Uncharacterized protein n=1 Tax=candidate division WOR-3 bacterium TaxID=2052148 RepID=A0A9D5KB88_UNCW3|nr:hypothetical protein [candidate division WOR-3 bacterium]MBD3364581.1 hypothetical protein [candidate division WOR-3 bacterium]
MNETVYKWKPKDKLLYVLSMIPFLAVFAGASYILATYSIYLMLILFALYIITNVFQAGCCVGCPYRGKYCPALCGVYLGNLLSVILYRNRKFDAKFFKVNATLGEIMVLVVALFPVYWVFRTAWYLLIIYFSLIAAHFVLFMSTQCGKCSYNKTCPAGQFTLSCRRRQEAKTE